MILNIKNINFLLNKSTKHTCLERSSLHNEYRVINFRASRRASVKPSATIIISLIKSKSGTTIAHGLKINEISIQKMDMLVYIHRKSALRFSGNSVRPA